MQAVVLTSPGSLDSLVLQQVPDPVPSAGEAVVRVHCAALNHRDLWIVRGKYAKIQTPVILGSDGAGVVEAVHDKEDSAWIGRHVIIDPSMDWGADSRAQGDGYSILGMPKNGTFAEKVCIPVSQIHEMPAHLNFKQAAALPLAGLTAFRALFTQGELGSGDRVLITGIGGGVAAMALAFAVAAGNDVAVSSRHEEKIEKAKDCGARMGVVISDPEVSAKVKAMGGFDLVIDGVGGPMIQPILNWTKPGGRIVVYGAEAGLPEAIDLRKIFWKQLTIRGSTMGTPQDFRKMLEFVNRHRIQPRVDTVWSMADVRLALERMGDALQMGKIVIHIQS